MEPNDVIDLTGPDPPRVAMHITIDDDDDDDDEVEIVDVRGPRKRKRKQGEQEIKGLKFTNKNGVMCRPIWKLMNELEMFKDAQTTTLENAKYLEQRVVNIPSSVIDYE